MASTGQIAFFTSPPFSFFKSFYTLNNIPTITALQEFNSKPNSFSLHQNYPNPFNPSTTIGFDLPEPAAVTLKIYNLLGQEVASPFTTQLFEAGHQSIEFDGRNLASGVYFYRIGATGIGAGRSFHEVRRMLILK